MINKPNQPKQASQAPSKQPFPAPSNQPFQAPSKQPFPAPSNQPFQASSGKVVLPASSGQKSSGQTSASATRAMSHISLSRISAPVSRGFKLLRSLPASRVIALTIALVLTACLALVALGASTLLHPTSSHAPQKPSTGRTSPSAPTATSPSAPTATSTPKNASVLTVQITSIPNSVVNGTTVKAQIQTSKPGVSVKLQVTYQISPFSSTSTSQITDNNGQATINWPLNVASFNGKTHATVTAVATDQNGQQVTSNPMTVTITNKHHND